MLWSFSRALAGGILIGAAAVLALFSHGRIAGISGIVGRAFSGGRGMPAGDSAAEGRHGSLDARAFRLPFLAGLIVVGAIVALVAPHAIGAAPPGRARLVVAGALVGVGTTLANGCTSGHGVCGLGRGSPRSLVAVLSFIGAGMITVAIAGSV